MAGETTGYISRIHWGGKDYAIKDFTAAESAEIAQTAATQANKAHIAALQVVSSTRQLIGGDEILDYDSSKTYHKNDICTYNGKMWVVVVDSTTGVWDQDAWEETSMWNELNQLRNPDTTLETLRLNIFKQSETADGKAFENAVFTITVSGESTTYTATTGSMVFTFPFGTEYTITFPAATYVDAYGDTQQYNTPDSLTYTARMNTRNVDVTYTHNEAVFSVIYKNGDEVSVDAHYEAVQNGTAIDGHLDADTLMIRMARKIEDPVGQQYSINVCVPIRLINTNMTSGGITTGRQWLQSNTQLTKPVNNTTNNVNSTASVHYKELNGYKNTAEMLDSCAKQNLRSDAALFATSRYMTINGTKHYGYMMAIGQFYQLAGTVALYKEFLAATRKCGSTLYFLAGDADYGSGTINLRSGYWWSSSQCNASFAWRLHGGSLYGYAKDGSNSVLPVFDF